MSDKHMKRFKPGRDPKPTDRTDWTRLEAMTDEQLDATACADPDNQPLTPEQLANAKRATPDLRTLRSRLGMTQEQFSRSYRLPIGTVRDWEQGRSRPDAPAQTLLREIEGQVATLDESRMECMKWVGIPPAFRERVARRQRIRARGRAAGLSDADLSALDELSLTRFLDAQRHGESFDALDFIEAEVTDYVARTAPRLGA